MQNHRGVPLICFESANFREIPPISLNKSEQSDKKVSKKFTSDSIESLTLQETFLNNNNYKIWLAFSYVMNHRPHPICSISPVQFCIPVINIKFLRKCMVAEPRVY